MMNVKNFLKILIISTSIIFVFPSTSSASLVNKTITQTLTSGLVGHWTMDQKDATWSNDTTGTILDRSGNGYTGTFTNMSRAISQVAGKIGQGVRFNGTDDYVDTSNEILGTYDSFTVSFWVKVATGEGGNFINRGSDGFGNGWSMAIAVSPGASLGGYTVMQGEQQSVSSSGTVTAGAWTYVTFVVSQGNYLKIYRNGVLEGTTNTTRTGLRTSTVGVRFCTVNGGYCIGTMDDARIYNRVLLETEIKQLYNLSASKFNSTPTLPLTSGLVGHWTMDGKDSVWTSSTAGTVIDKSGNGNTGTFTNMERATAPVAGKIGQGMKFDGSDDYVLASNTGEGATNLTISVWSYPRSITADQYLVSKNTVSTHRAIILGYQDNYYNIYGQPTGYPTGNAADSQISATANEWQHIVYTTDGSRVLGYKNGVKIIDVAGSLDSNSDNWLIGAYRSGVSTYAQFYNGNIDDVRIYNRVLSATEISQLYNLGASKFNATPMLPLTSGLVGHWTMDGKDTVWTSSTAGTVVDKSGNGNTGTLTNMARATAPVAGKIGQGMKFDGSDDYVDAGTPSSLDISGDLSVSLWAHSPNTSGNHILFSKHHLPSNISNYEGYLKGSSLYWWDGITETDTTVTISANTWTHIVFMRVGSTVTVYKNGISSGSVSVTAQGSVSGSFQLARDKNGQNFGGSLDDVRIYNRALSATEIQQLYNMGR